MLKVGNFQLAKLGSFALAVTGASILSSNVGEFSALGVRQCTYSIWIGWLRIRDTLSASPCMWVVAAVI